MTGKKGTEEFEEFALARTNELMRAAVALTGSSASAEDLVQETLTRAFVKWHHVLRAGNPVGYVRSMQMRIFLDSVRKRSNTEVPTDRVPDGAARSLGDVADSITLREALQRLQPIDRAIVVQRYVMDVDVQSVANSLDMSSEAVRSRALRALRTLRQELGHPTLDTTMKGRNTSHG